LESRQTLSEKAILEMQVLPEMITASDIRRYEQLMSGKAIQATSNAFTTSLRDVSSLPPHCKTLHSRHHWNIQGSTGPLEVEFERPTSLIALNIELTFNCRDNV
jgi:hypothetical protein